MVAGIDQGESTGAVAVVDVGCVGTDDVPFQGYGEAPQPTLVTPYRVAGASSDGPQSPLHLICANHCLKGLQQQKRTVLTLSCSMQRK